MPANLVAHGGCERGAEVVQGIRIGEPGSIASLFKNANFLPSFALSAEFPEALHRVVLPATGGGSHSGCVAREGHVAHDTRFPAPAVQAVAAPPATPELEKKTRASSSAPGTSRFVVGDSLESTYQEQLVAFQGAAALPQLLSLVERRVSQFSPLSLATAFHRVALLGGHDEQARCRGLVTRVEEVLEDEQGSFRAQSLANMGWAVAKLSWPCPGLHGSLASASLRQLSRFKSAELSMVLWGLASSPSAPANAQQDTLKAVASEFRRRGPAAFDAQSIATIAYAAGMLLMPADDELWPTISRGSRERVDEFSDRQVANLVWGFATVAHSDSTAPLFSRVEGCHVKDLAPIDLSLIAWAMAKVSQGGDSFFKDVADAVVAKREMWKQSDTRNIATLIYAFALAEQAQAHEPAFRTLAEAVCNRLDDFAVQGLTNAIWGYATACFTEPSWFATVASEVMKRSPSEFEPLDIANCLWAFATVTHSETPAISKLKELGRETLQEFTAQNGAITLWSFATLQVRDEAWFEKAADFIVQHLAECKSQELNNTLWACATVGVRLPWLFIKADNHALSIGLSEFKMHELSITMWAHGTAGVCNHPFFDAVIEEVLERRGIESCTPREVSNTAWAYSTIIGRAHAPWLAAVAAYTCDRIFEFDMQCIGNVLWSFSNVGVVSEALFRCAARETAARCEAAGPEACMNVAQVLSAMHAARIEEPRLLEAAARCFLQFEGSIGARELIVLANAAALYADRVGSAAAAWWPPLEAALSARVLEPLLGVLRPARSGPRPPSERAAETWTRLDAVVGPLDFEHLGVHFTARLLRESGLAAEVCVLGDGAAMGGSSGLPAAPPWAAAAALACADERARIVQEPSEQTQKLSRQLDKVNKREIVAWVSFDVWVGSAASPQQRQQLAEPGRTCSWRPDFEDQAGRSSLLRPLMTKSRQGATLVGEHDRSGHAERGALLEVADSWLAAVPGGGGRGASPHEVSGSLRLYVTHFPCISCIGVISQFACLFPGVS
eukprot:CAMPEP_0177441382 /NCGR_PEP_ID=MMETSP0369-20130122/4377_1 /TAXON_ID=447022 ORGANISM="Scrippsiella hangoei-like, Strain SHHI-4" /NCGR_SAMPLE_ID=MMETSP0369 /ASSEMBLY_ACC=CAM_ASM_000364 /LENGTH=1013 /DNA_ID=CAMNT_0018913249 /DNA_START=163 /DNA_END=3202 /DNA_ORIENTATION=+